MALLEYDAIVDINGQGNYDNLADAEAAFDGGPYMVYVKAGSYAPGATLTIDSDHCVWVFEPGTTFDSAITASGNGVCIILGAGCDIQGLITLSGVGCSVICENSVDLDGILASGDDAYVNGGGWDTISDGGIANDAIDVTGDDGIIENIAVQTTAGGGQAYDGVDVTGGSRSIVHAVKVVASDDQGINLGTDALALGCVILAVDDRGLTIGSAGRARVIGNYITESASATGAVTVGGAGDNSVMVGNIVQDPTGDSIDIDSGGENCVAVGNRVDGAIDDNSGTSTVAQNDATAF